jgi:hypothetical protein
MIPVGVQIFLALRFGVIHTQFGRLNKYNVPGFFWTAFIFESLFFAFLAFAFVKDLSRPIKSINGIIETNITFINKSGQPIKVYWLDYEGKRKLYANMKAEDSYVQQTYVTHPWLITDADDNAWDVYFRLFAIIEAKL